MRTSHRDRTLRPEVWAPRRCELDHRAWAVGLAIVASVLVGMGAMLHHVWQDDARATELRALRAACPIVEAPAP